MPLPRPEDTRPRTSPRIAHPRGALLWGPAWASLADAGPVTLAEAITRARESRRWASAQLIGQRGGPGRAARQPLRQPVIELRTETRRLGASPSLDLDTFAVVTQPIELGGKFAGQFAAAAGASAVHAAGVDRELAREVAGHYLDVLRARSASSSLTTEREELDEIVRILGRRAAEGAVETDLHRFESERAVGPRVRADLAIHAPSRGSTRSLGAPPADLVLPGGAELAPPPADLAANLDARSDVAAAAASPPRARRSHSSARRACPTSS